MFWQDFLVGICLAYALSMTRTSNQTHGKENRMGGD